jgi:hypothetical protein
VTLACALVGALAAPAASAADAPRAATAPSSGSRLPAAPPPSAAPVDPELLEFLGGDDVEAELLEYVAKREPAKSAAREGSSGR